MPRKNLELIGGRSLLRRSLDSAFAAETVGEVVVSTDDEEIAAEASRCGVEVGFRRPPELATDAAGDQGVLAHAIDWLVSSRGVVASTVVLLRPTAPFRRAPTIDRAVRELLSAGAEVVRTVVAAAGVGHPYWALRTDDDGWAAPFVESVDMIRYSRSQLLPPAFHLAGVVDVMDPSVLRDPTYVWGKRTRLLEVDQVESLDIDTPTDLLIAQSLAERCPELVS